MSGILVAAPGDPVASETKTVFLSDENIYALSGFAAHFEKVETGPGIERVEMDGHECCRLSAEALGLLQKLKNSQPHVLFFVSSDTHVKTFLPLAKLFERSSFVVRSGEDYSAVRALEAADLEFERHGKRLSAWDRADVAVTGNDWGLDERLFIAEARKLELPTVCLQESIIDFDHPCGMMQWADFAMIQGTYTLRYLKRDLAFMTGNPRYDEIKALPLPETPKVFINCNFTYGIFEDIGRAWVEDAVEASTKLDVQYEVSVHPRCKVDLSGIGNTAESNAFVVHEQLRTSSIIVTRFSSLAHEALLMGRHAVYYNPHGENMRYLNEDSTGLLLKAQSKDELDQCMKKAIDSPPPIKADGATPCEVKNLFTATDGRSHERCSLALRAVAEHVGDYRACDYREMSIAGLKTRILYQDKIRPALQRSSTAKTIWRIAKKLTGRK